jgi:hypothetical protein
MKKDKEAVLKCILDSDEICDPNCTMFDQCWNETEINKKKNEEPN